jgi:glycerophosphoryl diester phosphodiesterase
LASFRRAIDLGIYGSEMDVYITTDGVVVLNHDATINGINVENSTYDDLKNIKLSNGEPMPTLRNCIILAKERNTVKLVIEIKPHSTTTNENRAVDAVVQLVEEYGITHLVDYISFSQNICKRLIAKNPKNRVAYLNGNLTPDALYNDGYWGLDYSSSVLKSNTSWVKRAQNLGITTNVWTVNSTEDFEYFISMGVNFITTDYPQNLKQLLTTYK